MDFKNLTSVVYISNVLMHVQKRLENCRAASVMACCWPLVSVIPWIFQEYITELNLSLAVLSWESPETSDLVPRLPTMGVDQLLDQARFLHRVIEFVQVNLFFVLCNFLRTFTQVLTYMYIITSLYHLFVLPI